MAKKKHLKKSRPTLERLEDRTLLSSGSWIPLDQVLLSGMTQAGSIPPLSALNLFSPDTQHALLSLPPGQKPPPGSIETNLGSPTGQTVYAVGGEYIAKIDVTGLSAAQAADPKQLLLHAQGELAVAKAVSPSDPTLASVSIDKYLGAGEYLITASANANPDISPFLQGSLAKLPGFVNVMPDYLFPPGSLKTQTSTSGPAPQTSSPPPAPVPTFGEIGAPGGLVFSGSTSQTIAAGSTISYTVFLNAGQTVAAIVTPDANLQPTLTITNANGGKIASASGSAPGSIAAIQAIKVNSSGTYHVVGGGVNFSSGKFTLQVLVNSLLNNQEYLGGPSDGSLGSAQQIDTFPLNLGNGVSRSAVLGNLPLVPAAGDAFVSERNSTVQLVSSSGVIEATFSNSALSAGVVNGMHIGPNGNLYVGVDTSPGNGTGGEIVEMTQSGSVVTVINLPSDPNQGGFFYYPFGFAVASDGTLWVAQPNTGNVVHVDASGNLIQSYAVGGNPEWAAVRSDGQVFISQDSNGTIQQLDPSSGNVTTFATDPAGLPFGLSFDANNNLVVADPNVGIEIFNTSGSLIQTISDFNAPIDAEVDPSGNILASTFFSSGSGGALDKFTSSGTLISSTSVPSNAMGLGVLGTEGPPPATPPSDYYKFTVTAGQTVTLALTSLGGNAGSIDLEDGSGNVLAIGQAVSSSEVSIDSFVAKSAGTYYVHVTANGVQYSLIEETGGNLGNGNNTSQATAQNLFANPTGAESVMGALTATSLWGVDWQNAANQLIHTINTQTGAFTSTFQGPTTPLTNPFGFNMAFDGTNLWFNDGAFFGSNTIFKLNPTTGAVLGSFAAPASFTGLAYLNGYLWGTDVNFNIYQIDPSTGNLVSQFQIPGDNAVTGLAGDPSRNVLWAVSQFHKIYEINPTTQSVITSANDGLSLNEQDIGYNNNELYVSETFGPGANDIAVFNANSLTETRDLPMNVSTYISGLAADGYSLVPSNYYHISTKAKDTLNISITTPYASGPFLPKNTLSPLLQLFDANGNLLASGTTITYNTKTGGDYYVSVSGQNGTYGDYVLTVKGAHGPLPAFTVTGTNPPANSYNKPISSITVDFNDSIYLPSLANANVTFDGLAATGYKVDSATEVTWYLQPTPPGLNVPYVFQIAAGSITDIHGVGLAGFSETIIINTVPPHLIYTSTEEGDITSAGNYSYTTVFQEPIVPSSVTAASFDLHGQYLNADYTPTSWSFDSTDTVLTVNWSNVPQDNYTLTLFSAGFTDRSGYHLDGLPHTPRPPSVPTGNGQGNTDFFVDFTLRHQAEALPATLSSVAPAGDLIYQGSFTDVVANPPGAVNQYTVNLAAGQTLTLDLTSDGNLQGKLVVYDPSGKQIGTATAKSKGAEVVLQTAAIKTAGTYTIVVSGANLTEGKFNLNTILNSAVTIGQPGTLKTAQNINGSFVTLKGNASRGAVLGGINQLVVNTGDAYASERGGPGVVVVANAGGIESSISNPVFSTGVVQGMHEGPNGDLYVGLDTSPGNGTGGEILQFSPTGTLLATIKLPNDPNKGGFFYYPFGFSIASDGTFWVAAPNNGNVVHVDAAGNLIKSYSVGGTPEWTAVRSDGQVFVSQENGGIIQQLDPTSGNVTTFASDPYGLPFGLTFVPAGSSSNLWVSDPNVGVEVFDPNGNLIQIVYDGGALDAQNDPSGNFLVGNANFVSVDKFDPNGNFITSTGISGFPIGLSVAGVDGPAPPPASLDNFYKFSLNAGQSTTIVYNQLGGTGTATVTLDDANGNVLATASTGATNYTQGILNFVASAAGTYYIDVHGNSINYSLTVTKNANFDTEPNDTQATAQTFSPSGTALGAISAPPGVSVGMVLQGVPFSQNNCGCIPPDTNDAVGPTQVVEVINTAVEVFDKSTGAVVLGPEDLNTFLGISNAFSDPYIVYDDIANRFVMVELTFNNSGGDGVTLAVSNDSNILDGWQSVNNFDFGSNLLDFPKVGFNADAYVITGNLFSSSGTPLQYIAVDKSQLFQGNLVDYMYQRDSSHFRAEVPAQMHGATSGMPMYLVEEAGYGNGHAVNVVTLTNELSNNPTFVDTNLTVDPYGFPAPADQPGGPGTVTTNDTTFSHADWRMINGQGMLVSAQNVSVPDDNFSTSRVRWYEFNTSTATPTLVQQGTINPGPGVSTYYGAPALDANGDIGITYMESSINEYVSMYVAGRLASDPLGTMGAGTAVAPGIQYGPYFFRTGDYGGMEVDPTNLTTFWAAHEYMGTDGVFNTALASFTITPPVDNDYYSVNVNAGNTVKVTVTLPGSTSGGQFANNLSPVVELLDPNGNVVASGTTSLSYKATSGGTYAVLITGANGTQGEYVLQVTGATGTPPPIKVPLHSTAPTPTPAISQHVAAPAPQQSSAHGPSGTVEFSPLLATASNAATQPSTNVVVPASTSTTRPGQGSMYASDAFFVLFGRGSHATEEESLLSTLANTTPRVSDEGEMKTNLN